MTRLEYELLREQEPQLKLPYWYRIVWGEWESNVDGTTREELIASRTADLLSREYPPSEFDTDAMRYLKPKKL